MAVVELAAQGARGPVEALLSRAGHRELKLKVGQAVFLRAEAARIYPAHPGGETSSPALAKEPAVPGLS